jgi:hypothetical protein
MTHTRYCVKDESAPQRLVGRCLGQSPTNRGIIEVFGPKRFGEVFPRVSDLQYRNNAYRVTKYIT